VEVVVDLVGKHHQELVQELEVLVEEELEEQELIILEAMHQQTLVAVVAVELEIVELVGLCQVVVMVVQE
jgi:hypothetical protein